MNFFLSPAFWEVVIGILVLYLSLAIKWTHKPDNWVIEINLFPGIPTIAYPWEPGLHILWFPIKPIMFVRNRLNVAEKPITIHMGMGEGKGVGRPDPIDFADMQAGALIQVIYQVINPLLATYAVEETDLQLKSTNESGQSISIVLKGYERATLNKLEAEFRSLFGSYDFNVANTDKMKTIVEKKVMGNKTLHAMFAGWGVKIITVDIIEFILAEKESAIRLRRLAATTDAQVLIIGAESQKTAEITIAEGEKQAASLAGEGEFARIKAVAGAGLDPANAAAYVLAQGSTKALAKTSTTVIATSESGMLSQLASMAGMVKGVLDGGNQPPSPTPPASPASDTPVQEPAAAVAQASSEKVSERPSKGPLTPRRRNAS
ncbi:MAG: hypothetical protein A2878_03380 [Candidatus Moranbacteria bacterium RIFCSPHIGHO2_01_FULL_54_31]|nr:MAG: hypothetical protein A2878_03380 [Candidatus Moranbacteria bacterium RIFCSPHIGHO2_01_FULL_54_31]